jgi:hypothetical protein
VEVRDLVVITVASRRFVSLHAQLTNGRSTQISVLSICDIVGPMGQTWLADASLEQAAFLDALAKPGGTGYCIAGMRH